MAKGQWYLTMGASKKTDRQRKRTVAKRDEVYRNRHTPKCKRLRRK